MSTGLPSVLNPEKMRYVHFLDGFPEKYPHDAYPFNRSPRVKVRLHASYAAAPSSGDVQFRYDVTARVEQDLTRAPSDLHSLATLVGGMFACKHSTHLSVLLNTWKFRNVQVRIHNPVTSLSIT